MTQHDIAPEDHVKCLWLHSSPFYLFTLSPWISFTLALTPVTLAIVFVVIAAKRRDVKGSLGHYNPLSTWERPFSRHHQIIALDSSMQRAASDETIWTRGSGGRRLPSYYLVEPDATASAS